MRKFVGVAGFLLVVGMAPRAHADLFGFGCITHNLASDCAIGEAQLELEVTDAGWNQVLFTFTNTGLDASSITQVYFDTDAALETVIVSILPMPGVDFSEGATPPVLPGGTPISFVVDTSAGANPAVQPNGVNPGESLGILIDPPFDEVIAALYSGDLRVGIHVQGFASGGSESFVAMPTPEPHAALLFLVGTAVAAGSARRRRTAPPITVAEVRAPSV
jgi:hypothetical protein